MGMKSTILSRVTRRILPAAAGLLLVASLGAAGEKESEPQIETATFSMYCYWTGEATLGRVPGVVASRIGHLDGNEVVEVDYDPARVDLGDLIEALKHQGSFYSLIVPSAEERAAARRYLAPGEIAVRRGETRFVDPKHSLKVRHPDLYYLDLTEEQTIALNSWSHFGGPMPDVLSPEQRQRWQRIREKLRGERPRGLDPAGSRSGAALAEYRAELVSWLEG